MKINKIIMIVISIILVAYIQPILVTDSYIEKRPDHVTYDGKVLKLPSIYHPPQILLIGTPTSTMDALCLLFIQSVPGIIIQIFIIYSILNKLLSKIKIPILIKKERILPKVFSNPKLSDIEYEYLQ